ncbi:hypothetical protein DID73_02120 [Candidatus Marinamargulisbacteria bacterium SCGC AG-343-K17]|nr:hypothetical protein DID73_02120 [Candidatus Marinamargulisbacteria bacterium SCGC AG-343-K17]
MRIGYLGPQGTFTHFACEKAIESSAFTDILPVEYQSLDRLFDALNDGNVDAIFSPIENSIEGPVNRVLDALTHSNEAFIDTTYSMPINQSILSFNPTIVPNHISDIVSMPHAIAQCYAFIKEHCPNATLHHAPSTAGSVPMVEALNLPQESTVVIGHQGISKFFPIHVIEKNIQDQKKNTTQFSLIKRAINIDSQPPAEAHCLLAFSTPKDAPGSLLNVLEIFKSNQINLSKILSRPEKSDMGSYIFYIEFPTNFDTLSMNDLFSQIKKKSLFFKHLGFYRSHIIDD